MAIITCEINKVFTAELRVDIIVIELISESTTGWLERSFRSSVHITIRSQNVITVQNFV